MLQDMRFQNKSTYFRRIFVEYKMIIWRIANISVYSVELNESLKLYTLNFVRW